VNREWCKKDEDKPGIRGNSRQREKSVPVHGKAKNRREILSQSCKGRESGEDGAFLQRSSGALAT